MLIFVFIVCVEIMSLIFLIKIEYTHTSKCYDIILISGNAKRLNSPVKPELAKKSIIPWLHELNWRELAAKSTAYNATTLFVCRWKLKVNRNNYGQFLAHWTCAAMWTHIRYGMYDGCYFRFVSFIQKAYKFSSTKNDKKYQLHTFNTAPTFSIEGL